MESSLRRSYQTVSTVRPLVSLELPLFLFLMLCSAAHHLVATTAGLQILHRDITDDNIVIFPKVDTQGGVRKLVWKGILADWEISKPITMSGSSRARQPERTVRRTAKLAVVPLILITTCVGRETGNSCLSTS